MKARAVLMRANQRMDAQFAILRLGMPWVRMLVRRRSVAPMPMLMVVTTSGGILAVRLTARPMMEEMAFAPIAMVAKRMPRRG